MNVKKSNIDLKPSTKMNIFRAFRTNSATSYSSGHINNSNENDDKKIDIDENQHNDFIEGGRSTIRESNSLEFALPSYNDQPATETIMPLHSSLASIISDSHLPGPSQRRRRSMEHFKPNKATFVPHPARRRLSLNMHNFHNYTLAAQSENVERLMPEIEPYPKHTRRRSSIHAGFSSVVYSENEKVEEGGTSPTVSNQLHNSYNRHKSSRRLSLNSKITSFEREIDLDVFQIERGSIVDMKPAKHTNSDSSTGSSSGATSLKRQQENMGNFENDIILDKERCPNTPHPSLEYPLLYFLLKCLPQGVMVWIRNLYKIRWELSYPLQKRVPFSKFLRKIGIYLTWGELLLWIPFVLILIQGMMSSFVNPSVAQSGIVARLPLAICFLTANHNSLLTMLLGIPFERALKYHKVSGYCAFINGIFHTYIAFVVGDTETKEDGKSRCR
jgi:hypothetical protein